LEEAVRRVEREAAQRASDVRVPTLIDFVTAADDMCKATAPAKRRSSILQANAPVNPFSPIETITEVPSMIVTGDATGRLVGFWRWRSLPPRRVA